MSWPGYVISLVAEAGIEETGKSGAAYRRIREKGTASIHGKVSHLGAL
jgi:hypothetical protein